MTKQSGPQIGGLLRVKQLQSGLVFGSGFEANGLARFYHHGFSSLRIAPFTGLSLFQVECAKARDNETSVLFDRYG